jgi:putative transposase
MGVVRMIVMLFRAFMLPRAALAAEIVALRQQLSVLQRSVRRPRLRRRDRIFWVWLSRLWADWRSSLVTVKPETVVRWHSQGFRLYRRWKSRKQPGRPRVEAERRAA